MTLDACSSWLERDTENLKYVLEMRRHWLYFLFSVGFCETAPSGSKIELKLRTVLRKLIFFWAFTLIADSSWLEKATENVKYVLETRRHCLSFLFEVGFCETSPSGSKIELKIRTVWRKLKLFLSLDFDLWWLLTGKRYRKFEVCFINKKKLLIFFVFRWIYWNNSF